MITSKFLLVIFSNVFHFNFLEKEKGKKRKAESQIKIVPQSKRKSGVSWKELLFTIELMQQY